VAEPIPYWHIDAFADAPFTGNQAAVLLLNRWLPDATLRAIAAENLFAETAFVVREDGTDGAWALRWFTPACEVRLCGHATLAAGHALMARDGGHRVRFRTRRAGVLDVRRSATGYELALPAIPVESGSWPDAQAALGGPPAREMGRHPDGYTVWLYGSAREVAELAPDFRALAALGDAQFIATAPGADHPSGADVVSRVFVPGAGVDEDSVTGSAHAALTPFWAERLGLDCFTAFQASARGGRLTCRRDGERVWLGGGCVTVVEGRFYL
jgi:predicted PhzF superfamily epimerase YddE/YHI9